MIELNVGHNRSGVLPNQVVPIAQDDIALTIVTTVVSRHEAHGETPARMIVDAG